MLRALRICLSLAMISASVKSLAGETGIEILKGPATPLYGSGAVGGVVNTVTNRIPTRVPDAPSVDGYFRFDGATNELTGGGKVEAGLGNLAV